MRTFVHLRRQCVASVAAMEKDSQDYLRSFCISVAVVTIAAALPSFIL